MVCLLTNHAITATVTPTTMRRVMKRDIPKTMERAEFGDWRSCGLASDSVTVGIQLIHFISFISLYNENMIAYGLSYLYCV